MGLLTTAAFLAVAWTPTAAAAPTDIVCDALPELGSDAPADPDRTCRSTHKLMQSLGHRLDRLDREACALTHRADRILDSAGLPRETEKLRYTATSTLERAACEAPLGEELDEVCRVAGDPIPGIDITKACRSAGDPIPGVDVGKVCRVAGDPIPGIDITKACASAGDGDPVPGVERMAHEACHVVQQRLARHAPEELRDAVDQDCDAAGDPIPGLDQY